MPRQLVQSSLQCDVTLIPLMFRRVRCLAPRDDAPLIRGVKKETVGHGAAHQDPGLTGRDTL